MGKFGKYPSTALRAGEKERITLARSLRSLEAPAVAEAMAGQAESAENF